MRRKGIFSTPLPPSAKQQPDGRFEIRDTYGGILRVSTKLKKADLKRMPSLSFRGMVESEVKGLTDWERHPSPIAYVAPAACAYMEIPQFLEFLLASRLSPGECVRFAVSSSMNRFAGNRYARLPPEDRPVVLIAREENPSAKENRYVIATKAELSAEEAWKALAETAAGQKGVEAGGLATQAQFAFTKAFIPLLLDKVMEAVDAIALAARPKKPKEQDAGP